MTEQTIKRTAITLMLGCPTLFILATLKWRLISLTLDGLPTPELVVGCAAWVVLLGLMVLSLVAGINALLEDK